MGFYSLLLLVFGLIVFAIIYSRFTIRSLKINLLFTIVLSVYLIVFYLTHHNIEKTCELLISDNVSELVTIIQSWGVAAPIISILLMILQAVIAPIPAYLITAANGIIFGITMGVIISTIGALLGALISFSITRWFYSKYGSQIIRNRKARDYIDKISSEHGFKFILVARLIPVISFDLISYAAGASNIKTSQFLLATFIGMLPATIVYTMIANKFGEITKLSGEFVLYSSLFALILVVLWVVKSVLIKPSK